MTDLEARERTGDDMKWFKSKKKKKIEALEAQVEFFHELTDTKIRALSESISYVQDSVDRARGSIRDLKFVSPYRVESQKTETLVCRYEVPHGFPITTEDIESRLANLLAEQVAKYMVVQKDFMRDPLADDVYRAMVKVVPYPVEEKRFYEMG